MDNAAKKLGIIIIIVIIIINIICICINISNNFAVPAEIIGMLSKVLQIDFMYIAPFYSILPFYLFYL